MEEVKGINKDGSQVLGNSAIFGKSSSASIPELRFQLPIAEQQEGLENTNRFIQVSDMLPGDEPSSHDEWKAHLSKFEELKGCLDNAALFMQSFNEGKTKAVNQHADKPGYRKPSLRIDTKLPGSYEGIATTEDGLIIGVETSVLKKYAGYDMSKLSTFYRDGPNLETPEVIFIGTVPQFAHSSGVHEGDHTEYMQTHPATKGLPSTVPLAIYDAQPHEYRALGLQIKDAIESSFSEETVDCLRVRVINANQEQRAQQRVKTDTINTIKQQFTPPSATGK